MKTAWYSIYQRNEKDVLKAVAFGMVKMMTLAWHSLDKAAPSQTSKKMRRAVILRQGLKGDCACVVQTSDPLWRS